MDHLCVEGRAYLLDAPTALRQWERGEKRYSLRSLVFALQNVHLPHASRAKVPSLAAPQLASCASSGRAWWLRAARHSQGEAGPLGAQPLPRVLEPSGSRTAHFPAFDHSGAATTARPSVCRASRRAASWARRRPRMRGTRTPSPTADTSRLTKGPRWTLGVRWGGLESSYRRDMHMDMHMHMDMGTWTWLLLPGFRFATTTKILSFVCIEDAQIRFRTTLHCGTAGGAHLA